MKEEFFIHIQKKFCLGSDSDKLRAKVIDLIAWSKCILIISSSKYVKLKNNFYKQNDLPIYKAMFVGKVIYQSAYRQFE